MKIKLGISKQGHEVIYLSYSGKNYRLVSYTNKKWGHKQHRRVSSWRWGRGGISCSRTLGFYDDLKTIIIRVKRETIRKILEKRWSYLYMIGLEEMIYKFEDVILD